MSAKEHERTQSERFKEAARELGCDEDPAHFEEKLKKVAAHKRVEQPTVPPKSDDDGYFIEEKIDVLPAVPTKTANIDPDAGLRPRSKQSKRGASSRQTRRSGRK